MSMIQELNAAAAAIAAVTVWQMASISLLLLFVPLSLALFMSFCWSFGWLVGRSVCWSVRLIS